MAFLEMELDDAVRAMELAQLRVAQLTKELELRRSLLAPIRRLNVDVLSSIFLCAAETDEMTPLRIGLVCRYWRTVILNIPRAWRFVDAKHNNRGICEIYHERSKQCKLHATGGQNWMEFLGVVGRRLCCLTIPVIMFNVILPMLTHLCLSSPSEDFMPPANLSNLTPYAFPVLKHLELHIGSYFAWIPRDLPPLRTLTVTVYDAQGWPTIISKCASSLKSLTITVKTYIESPVLVDTNLPNLTYLKISGPYESGNHGYLRLLTPSLTTYLEGDEYDPPAIVHYDSLDSIKHARFYRIPPFQTPTQLRTVQLTLELEEYDQFLDTFARNNMILPHLEFLEFQHGWMSSAEIAEARRILQAWDWTVFERLVHPPRLTQRWTVDLRAEDPPLCGENLPCTRWRLP